jgi:hypothetical protein
VAVAVAAVDGEDGNGGGGGGVRWPRVRHDEWTRRRHDESQHSNGETTRGRCNERTTSGNAATSQRGEKTGWWRDKRTRGPRDDR